MAKKKNEEIIPLNSKVYCVHNTFFTRNGIKNTTIKVGRVLTYKKLNNVVLPVIKEVGSKNELDFNSYRVTTDFKVAYNWLQDEF